jgi:glycosyltransferase involved in cell wall biosynthesis
MVEASLVRCALTVEGTAPLRILGETAYPAAAASARVRVARFDQFLRPHGVALRHRPMLTDDEYGILASAASPARKAVLLAASAARAVRPRPPHDVLLVHRLLLLTPLPGIDPPRRLDVYDLDDALFLGSAAEVNRRFQWVKQEARRSVECMRRASLVLAGNSFLAGKAREYGARAEVLPTCVDPERQPLRVHEAAEVVRVGWIGSRTTTKYLEPLVWVFEQINKHGLRARLVLVGAADSLRASWIEHRPWSLGSEASDLASFDIGIMPLPDTDWARGKCGYKILQYFAAGVPAIASPVGVNCDLIGRDRGLVASTPEEWRAALERLINDADERRERGTAARAFVERDYSYQRWAPELAALLRSLA